MKINVSFILICHNEKGRVVNAIKSIKKLKTKNTFEIFLVDNASSDGTVELVKKNFKYVKIIELNKNIGTPAYNKAIEQTKGDYIFFTASDVELKYDMLDYLVEFLNKNEDIAQVAPKYFDFYNRKKIDAAGTWLSRSFYSGIFKNNTLGNKNIEIPYMGTGLVRTNLVKKLGYIFDDDYFIYGEDVDFGLRIRLLGFKIYYVPKSIVYHIGSVSKKIYKQHYLTFLMERNLLTTFFKILSVRSIISLMPYVIFMRFVAIAQDIITLKFINVLERLRAMLWIMSNFNFILKKRQETQKLRKVKDNALLKVFSEKYLFSKK